MLNFADRASLLPGLRPASWRGKTFWVIDIEHEIGRRIHATLYPGLDLKTFDDTGPLDGPIDVSGLVIGDDYVQQAEALHAAFRKAGSGTFIHPWRGPIDCVLSRPARISFASDELRVARIDVTFEPTGEEVGGLLGGFLGGLAGGLFSSIAGIIGAVAGVVGAVLGVVNTVLSVAVMAVSIWNFGVAAVAGVIGIARVIVGATREVPRLVPIAISLSARAALASTLTGRPAVASALATILSQAPAELGAVFRPAARSGVGRAEVPGVSSSAASSAEPEPRRGAELMLRVADTLGAWASGTTGPELAAIAADPERAALIAGLRRPSSLTEKLIYLAAEAGFVAEAVSLATEIAFDSRQDAHAMQDRLDVAISAACERASVLAFEAPAQASALWQSLEKLRGVVAIDLSEIIGRLPAATRIDPPRGSSWLLAQHLAGDDPARVVETLHDIRRRNGLRHPALLGSDPVEVLR